MRESVNFFYPELSTIKIFFSQGNMQIFVYSRSYLRIDWTFLWELFAPGKGVVFLVEGGGRRFVFINMRFWEKYILSYLAIWTDFENIWHISFLSFSSIPRFFKWAGKLLSKSSFVFPVMRLKSSSWIFWQYP